MHFASVTPAALLFAGAAKVVAHGHVKSYIIGSATYTAFLPVNTPVYWDPPPSIARNTGGEGPVENFLGNDMVCNFNATPIHDNGVSRTGPIAAGDKITIQWNSFSHGGPIMTYLARCDPDCGKFTGIGTKSWFKIDEAGYNLTTMNGWATQLHFDQGNKWISTIPSCLAPGEYLLRHEIIAIGACKNAGSCQLYPSCVQLKVTGSGTVRPEDGSVPLVTFPGAYEKGDPGVFWNSSQDKSLYVPPGPRVWKCPTVLPSASTTLSTTSRASSAPSSLITTTRASSSITTTTSRISSIATTSRTSTTTSRTSTTTSRTSTKTSQTSSSTITNPAPITTSQTTTPSTGSVTVAQWGQCGGTGWTGGTICQSPYVCTPSGEWYSQCI